MRSWNVYCDLRDDISYKRSRERELRLSKVGELTAECFAWLREPHFDL